MSRRRSQSRRAGGISAILAVSLALGTSACTVVGYPGRIPSAPPPRTTGTGAAAGTSESDGDRGLTDAQIAAIPDAVPEDEPRSPYGNPDEYQVAGVTYHVLETAEGYEAVGMASWYGEKFQGRRTSSGEAYDMYRMTAAHKTLPIPCYVEVTNLENGRRVVVRVNDRGPFHSDRIIDLSYVAARKLGIIQAGTARVRVRALTAR